MTFHNEKIKYLIIPIRCFRAILNKKRDIWCHKGYTDKNEKQVWCYVNLDGAETFSDT